MLHTLHNLSADNWELIVTQLKRIICVIIRSVFAWKKNTAQFSKFSHSWTHFSAMNAAIVCLGHCLSPVRSWRRALATKPVQFCAKGMADLMNAKTSAPFSVIRCMYILLLKRVSPSYQALVYNTEWPQSTQNAFPLYEPKPGVLGMHKYPQYIQSVVSCWNQLSVKLPETLVAWTLDP